MSDVCLVSMPYGGLTAPSIALGALTAEARRTGLSACSVYASFWFAERIGLANYAVLSESAVPQDLLGEWTFAGAAFPGFEPDHAAFLEPRLERMRPLFSGVPDLNEMIWSIRRQAAAFVDEAAQRVLALNPRIVGCSSTFQQHCASLALLRRIKELKPDVVTMIGGANCMGAMGVTTQRSFAWLDFVISGEADRIFPWLCHRILEKGPHIAHSELPPGISSKGCAAPDERRTEGHLAVPPIGDMDQLAVPDFDDYFQELRTFAYADFIRPGMPVETSRGCWWGQKHRCTFCGLFDTALIYRSKSPERVLSEFRSLAERHALTKFAVADLILDMKYFKTVLPHLTAEHGDPPYLFYYETKANLSEEQVDLLRRAGVRWIQPGVESLHDDVLKLMDKGSTALGNVALLKYTLEHGVFVAWNLLAGFPGEQDEWYGQMADWLPLLVHLQAPSSMITIRYDRFSEYWEQKDRYGLNLVPFDAYGYVYPLAPADLAGLAYFFEDHDANGRAVRQRRPGTLRMEQAIRDWRKLRRPRVDGSGGPVLTLHEEAERSIIVDTRPCALADRHVLEGLEHVTYRACRKPRLRSALVQELHAQTGGDDVNAAEKAIESLLTRKLLLQIGDRVLALATREPVRPFVPMTEFPAGFNFGLVRRSAALQKQMMLSVSAALDA